MYISIAEFRISDWRTKDKTNLVLRVYPNESFVAEDGLDGQPVEAGGVMYGEVPVAVNNETVSGYTSPTLVIPALTLLSTTDARVNPRVTYRAEIWNTAKSKKIASLPLLDNFRVQFSPTTITWTDIIQFNTPLPLGAIRSLDEEIKTVINTRFNDILAAIVGGTPSRIPKFSSGGNGLVDSSFAEITTGFAPIADNTKNLGSGSQRFANLYANGIVISSGGSFGGAVSITGNVSVMGNVSASAAVNGLNGVFTGTVQGNAGTFVNGTFTGALDAQVSAHVGVALPTSYTGLASRRLRIWDGSLSNAYGEFNSDATNPFLNIHDPRAEHAVQIHRANTTDDGKYALKTYSTTYGEAGINAQLQFQRIHQGITSFPVQTMSKQRLAQVAGGGNVEDLLASFVIPASHPSFHSGESYKFRAMGDLTGTTSTHIINVDIGGDVPATITIAPATNVKWEVTGSITLYDTVTGDYIVEGKITLSNGQVAMGYVKGTGLLSLGGVALEVTAKDSGTGETRCVFFEAFHEDFKR